MKSSREGRWRPERGAFRTRGQPPRTGSGSVFRFARFPAAVAAVLLTADAACGGGEQPVHAGRDDFGEPISVAARPGRIVSLSPTTTELLFALGAGDRLVGRTRWDLFPPAARAIPDLGDGIRPSVELLLAARPDLVVLYASNDNRDAARALRAAGIQVVALRIDSIVEFFRTAEILGAVTGQPGRARAVIDSVSASLERVRAATAGLPRPTVFFHAYENPLLTIGAGSYLSQLIEIAGGRNVFGDLPGPSPQVTFEEVLRRNPDHVLVAPVTAADLRASARWQLLPAVRDRRILVMDTTLTGRPGIRLGEAAWSLAQLLHPGVRR